MSNFITNTTQLQNAGWTMNPNKHYPITKCDILNYDHLLLSLPQLGWMVKLRNIFVFNYKFRATTNNKERKHKRAFLSFSQGIFGLSLLVTQVVCMGVGGAKKKKKRKQKKTHNTKEGWIPSLPQCCLLIHFPRLDTKGSTNYCVLKSAT